MVVPAFVDHLEFDNFFSRFILLVLYVPIPMEAMGDSNIQIIITDSSTRCG